MQELYIDSVNHRYGDRQVLNSVYLNCKIGEIVGVLGRNGSGKSTLLKVIFGNITPHFKHLKVNGQLIQCGYQTKQIAYLPQSYFIPTYLKLKTLGELFTSRYREQLMDFPVFRDNLEEEIGNLSGGNRRLIECLLIIYSDAPFVLLDEPFSQLSPLIIDELKTHLLKMTDQKGFIVTDHYYRQILSVASRIVLINNGCNYRINNEGDLITNGYLPT